MLTMTNPTVTREHVWTAFRCTPDVRLRERYHSMGCPRISSTDLDNLRLLAEWHEV